MNVGKGTEGFLEACFLGLLPLYKNINLFPIVWETDKEYGEGKYRINPHRRYTAKELVESTHGEVYSNLKSFVYYCRVNRLNYADTGAYPAIIKEFLGDFPELEDFGNFLLGVSRGLGLYNRYWEMTVNPKNASTHCGYLVLTNIWSPIV
jgi:hypothetical protein